MFEQLISDFKADRTYFLGFLVLVILIFVFLPSVVIIHYLKEKQLIKFPKLESNFFRNRIFLSLLVSLFISLPYILSGKISLLFSLGLILLLFFAFFPFFTAICSKGKEISFDSENKPIPKYGKNNQKRRKLGYLLFLLWIVNVICLYFLMDMKIPISDSWVTYYYVTGLFTMFWAVYFISIVECKYCSCLNFEKIKNKICKNCSLEID